MLRRKIGLHVHYNTEYPRQIGRLLKYCINKLHKNKTCILTD
jgi:hypothetical protein